MLGVVVTITGGLLAARRCVVWDPCPGRATGRLDELDQNAVARAWVDEGYRTVRSSARRGIDQLEALGGQAIEGGGEVLDLEADVVEPLPLQGEEARDAGRLVGRLDELDLGLAHGQEGDPDPVVLDVHDLLERGAERVPPEPEPVLDRGDDEGHVVDLAEAAQGGGNGRHGRLLAGSGRVHRHDDGPDPLSCPGLRGRMHDVPEHGGVGRRQPGGIVPHHDRRLGAGRVPWVPEDLLQRIPVVPRPLGQVQGRSKGVEELPLGRRAGQLHEPRAVLVGGGRERRDIGPLRWLEDPASTFRREHRVQVGDHSAIHSKEA
jgi:hypothetical protein